MCENTLRWFKHGVGMYPKWVDGLAGLSMVYFQLRDFDNALKYIQLAREHYSKKQVYYE